MSNLSERQRIVAAWCRQHRITCEYNSEMPGDGVSSQYKYIEGETHNGVRYWGMRAGRDDDSFDVFLQEYDVTAVELAVAEVLMRGIEKRRIKVYL